MKQLHFIIFAFTLLGLCFLSTGCEVKLERENIPLWLGIQLETDTSCTEDSWLANQQLQSLYPVKGWTIEVPIFLPENDSSTPRIPETSAILISLNRLASLSSQSCLHFSMQNPYRLLSDQIAIDTYISLIHGILDTLPFSPDKIMFSGFWIQEKELQQTLLSHFPTWQKAHVSSRFYLAGRYNTLISGIVDWNGSHDIAIINDAPPDEIFKAHFRKVNQALGAKALEHNKAIFIAQTNILGDNKLLLYKNQLRFWDEAVQVEGLTINSLYCQSSLADSSTRFGLARARELLGYLSGERD